jgi:hypothetical protein
VLDYPFHAASLLPVRAVTIVTGCRIAGAYLMAGFFYKNDFEL